MKFQINGVMIGFRKGLMLSCVCVCAVSGLVDCGGKGNARPGDSPESGGTSASGGAESAGRAGASSGTRSIGGAGSAGMSGAAGAPAKGCAAPTADGFETKWMPPETMPGACSAEQIAQEYALCGGASPKYDRTACRNFDVDPANSECLGCLFTAVDADVSGPIMVFPKNGWLANVGGCEALLDGDIRPTSCGAREQAASICEYGACLNACAPDATDQAWAACQTAASKACDQYRANTACSTLPRYATCHLNNFAEYFTTMGNLFCGSGPTAPSPEGGAGGADNSGNSSGGAGAGGAPP
jgi:hypothetical protein